MRRPFAGLGLLLALVWAGAAGAHPLRTGYLEARQAGADTYQVLWTMPADYGQPPAVEVVFDGRCVQLTSPSAVASGQRLTRSWTIRCPGGLGGTAVAASGLAVAQSDILVQVFDGDAPVIAGRLTPLTPSILLPEVATSTAIGLTYLRLGVEHILLGIDHLLFVTALVLLVRGWRRLAVTITAFTLAHSLTLGAAVLGYVHVPQLPVEALIALSIALVAGEVLRMGQSMADRDAPRAWRLAFAFGLLHGLGFAGALSEVGLPAHAIPVALLTFNLGVELGQVAFVAALLPLLAAARRWPAWLQSTAPYAIGSLAMFWTIERIASFWG